MLSKAATRFRPALAAILLVGVVATVFLPVGSFLHEVAEHDALELSHCACLVCHISVHTPLDAGAQAITVGDHSESSSTAAAESPNARAWRLDLSIPGRSPPNC